jgi:hypothetical protein
MNRQALLADLQDTGHLPEVYLGKQKQKLLYP